MTEILRLSRLQIPPLRIIDIVGDLRQVGFTGTRDDPAVDMVAFKCLLDKFGVRLHARAAKHWWPTEVIPWLGCVVDTNSSAARIGGKKASK